MLVTECNLHISNNHKRQSASPYSLDTIKQILFFFFPPRIYTERRLNNQAPFSVSPVGEKKRKKKPSSKYIQEDTINKTIISDGMPRRIERFFFDLAVQVCCHENPCHIQMRTTSSLSLSKKKREKKEKRVQIRDIKSSNLPCK